MVCVPHVLFLKLTLRLGLIRFDCSGWIDNNQYSTWNRTRRLHQTPYLARTDTVTSRRAAEMAQAQETIPVNVVERQHAETVQKERKVETLFGPNIGIVSSGPKWAEKHEKSSDELTPEIVKAWIAKSKQVRRGCSLFMMQSRSLGVVKDQSCYHHAASPCQLEETDSSPYSTRDITVG